MAPFRSGANSPLTTRFPISVISYAIITHVFLAQTRALPTSRTMADKWHKGARTACNHNYVLYSVVTVDTQWKEATYIHVKRHATRVWHFARLPLDVFKKMPLAIVVE